jgi:hypothetical protein
MFKMFKMKRESCGLCGGKLKAGSGVMQYRATNPDGIQEMFSMAICKGCADDIDGKTTTELDTQEVREWLTQK